MKTWKIYCHYNKINGKRYIGQTSTSVKDRWHNGNGYKRHFIFWKAIEKYGWDNFEHIILEDNISSIIEANAREQYWIQYYHTYINDPNCMGYNMTPGGMANGEISDATKQKISLKNKGKIAWNKGKHNIYSEEALAKMRTANLGRHFSEEVKAKISAASKGKKRTKETKRKIAEAKYKKVFCIELNKIFNSISEAAIFFNVSISTISGCLNGHAKTAAGYHWSFC